GNCLELFEQVTDESVSLIIADPPYNVYQDNIRKVPFQRRKKQVGFDVFNKDFLDFSQQWIMQSVQKLKKDGSIFIFGGVNYLKGNDLLALLPILREKLEFINLIVWHYKNGMDAKRFFSNRFELIAWFARDRKKYKFFLDRVRIKYNEKTLNTYLKDKRLNPETVKKGKNPTNVWEIPRLNANSREKLGHPTQKPKSIVERIIKATTDEGDLVLDPFVGSGTTLEACKDLKRDCIGFEINEKYVQMIEKRCNLK
ncbi:MAG: DNA-methyltransferase, partial [Candidatus Helarchaeota archaeon]